MRTEGTMSSTKFLLFFCYLFYFNGSVLVFTYTITSDLLPATCGEGIEDRIKGGETTERNEFPWLALLEYKIRTKTKFMCGGSLINSRYVLTAAHCVEDRNLVKVRLGEYNVTTDPDCEGEPDLIEQGLGECSDAMLRIDIEDTIIHPNADIALLRLSEEVSYTAWVKPICLPLSEELQNKDFNGIEMVVAGWGATENGFSSDTKLKVKVPEVDCSFAQNTRLYYKDITENHMCAGGEPGKDSCKGDSGGPLMYRSTADDNWYAVGIVAFGIDPCGLESLPAVHVRVTNYITWIISNLKP